MTAKLTYKDRGYNRTLLLVAGWGFDDRIFERLVLPYDYLLYRGSDMDRLEAAVLDRDDGPLDMLGWSQGGLALAQLAARHPERVGRLILVGVRPAYPAEGLDEVRALLLRSRATYMKRFYKACLDRADLPWFKQTLQEAYLAQFGLDDLMRGLDWLGRVRLDMTALQDIKAVTLVQGAEDQVAPVQEVRDLVAQWPEVRYCEVPGAAHAVFLHPEFADCVQRCAEV